MSEIIAQREFHSVGDGSLKVRWMKPQPDGQDWSCAYELEWSDKAVIRRSALGVDSAQALILALQAVGSDLRNRPDVYWWDPGEALGLPIPEGIDDIPSTGKS